MSHTPKSTRMDRADGSSVKRISDTVHVKCQIGLQPACIEI
jgi:hypothetical protein